MGRRKKKQGLTSLLKNSGETPTPPSKSSFSSWPWPSCNQQPRTDSFRAADDVALLYKSSVNSVYDSADSLFTHSDNDSGSFSISEDNNKDDSSESLIRSVTRSDRLLFEPGGDTSSILEESTARVPFKESVAMAMESEDPYVDFRKSMEEMVAAHGIKDWECLEELLVWYLRVNGKKTHGYIVGAFVDLLVGLAMVNHGDRPSRSSSSTTSSSSASSSSATFLSLSSRNCYEIEEVEEESGSS